MNTGEVGIIVKVNNDNGINPRILLVLGSDKKPKNERIVDMSKGDLTLTNRAYSIKKSLQNGAFGIVIEDYLNKGLTF